MITKDGELFASFSNMGGASQHVVGDRSWREVLFLSNALEAEMAGWARAGYTQPPCHVQLVSNLLDYRMVARLFLQQIADTHYRS